MKKCLIILATFIFSIHAFSETPKEAESNIIQDNVVSLFGDTKGRVIGVQAKSKGECSVNFLTTSKSTHISLYDLTAISQGVNSMDARVVFEFTRSTQVLHTETLVGLLDISIKNSGGTHSLTASKKMRLSIVENQQNGELLVRVAEHQGLFNAIPKTISCILKR